jgi:hypothetical protein
VRTPGTTVVCSIAAAYVVAGVLLDYSYSQSTPGAIPTRGTVVDFMRRNSKQVYSVFEFRDLDGKRHRVVNSTQQAVFRFAAGDAVAIAYSRTDPEKARIDTSWFDHRWVIAGVIVGLTLCGGAFSRGAGTRVGS